MLKHRACFLLLSINIAYWSVSQIIRPHDIYFMYGLLTQLFTDRAQKQSAPMGGVISRIAYQQSCLLIVFKNSPARWEVISRMVYQQNCLLIVFKNCPAR
jgi:hypothetical protein